MLISLGAWICSRDKFVGFGMSVYFSVVRLEAAAVAPVWVTITKGGFRVLNGLTVTAAWLYSTSLWLHHLLWTSTWDGCVGLQIDVSGIYAICFVLHMI
ncbi:hypothetical protein EDB84DRAFT_1516701 [Lactarius hengduanensis]|nr:hypothetical protein EDB84DRAFT_1516701 [Lactarius hengduanensis]